jgi:circadian clock protein KaiC
LQRPTYVSSGIAGLDRILGGGFLKEGFYLVQGDPGSGKTTLALQFLLKGSKEGERGLYISLTETGADLEKAAKSHGWSLEEIDVCDLTTTDLGALRESQYLIFHPSEVELGETTRRILTEVERVKPKRVVFDGLAELRLLASDALRYRRQLLALKAYFEEHKITVLLLDDRTSAADQLDPESLVGGNILMETYLPGYGGARRRIHVTKVRGSNFWDGYHDYEIREEGVLVHPRLVASKHHDSFEPIEFLSGIGNLDLMLQGGLLSGTTTLFLGPAGVGKSTLAMQYVAAALERGQRAAVFTFDEVIGTLLGRSEKLVGRGHIQKYRDGGQLHIRQVDPAELSPGTFAHEVTKLIDSGTKVLVIDSLNGYLNAMPEERFLPTHLHELFAYLNQKGVLTIVVVAQHGLAMAEPSELDVSYLADSVLLLRYFEIDAQIRQAVSVFKKRTGGHERTLRELQITSTGIKVGEPLVGFKAILTGVAEYTGSVRALEPSK